VVNTGPRRGSTIATTTFCALGMSNTIPSAGGPPVETLTRSPTAGDSMPASLLADPRHPLLALPAAPMPTVRGPLSEPRTDRRRLAYRELRRLGDGASQDVELIYFRGFAPSQYAAVAPPLYSGLWA
jgi:hypothetical protein